MESVLVRDCTVQSSGSITIECLFMLKKHALNFQQYSYNEDIPAWMLKVATARGWC